MTNEMALCLLLLLLRGRDIAERREGKEEGSKKDSLSPFFPPLPPLPRHTERRGRIF